MLQCQKITGFSLTVTQRRHAVPQSTDYLWMTVPVVIMFLSTYATELHGDPPFRSYQYPILAATISALLLSRFGSQQKLAFRMGGGIGTCVCVILSAIFFSAYSGDRGYFSALHIVLWHFTTFAFWLLFINRHPQQLRRGLGIAWLSIVLVAVVALLVGLFIQFIGPFSVFGLVFEHLVFRGEEYGKLVGWFTGPNRTGPFLMYGVIGCIFSLSLTNSPRVRQAFRLTAAGLTFGVFLVGSRSSIVACIIFLFVATAPWCKVTQKGVLLATFCVLLCLYAIILGEVGSGVIGDALEYTRFDRSIFLRTAGSGVYLENRDEAWAMAFDLQQRATQMEFFFGSGPGHIVTENEISSHSGWLSLWIEQGTVTLMVTVVLFVTLIVQGLRYYRVTVLDIGIRQFFLQQAAFWLAYGVINISTALFLIPGADNFVMLCALAQFCIVRSFVDGGQQLRSVGVSFGFGARWLKW